MIIAAILDIRWCRLVDSLVAVNQKFSCCKLNVCLLEISLLQIKSVVASN